MKRIFEETTIGSLKVKNRLVRSATMIMGDAIQGVETQKLHETYEALAKGGIGTVITGMISVMDQGSLNPSMVAADLPGFVSDFSEDVNAVHKHDCRIIAQLSHCGAKAHPAVGSSCGPSAIEGTDVKEITREEMKAVQAAFGRGALACRQAGADGVQIHGAHGYLISQFLSPYYNKRSDSYGGSLENRARFLFEVYEEVRNAVGREYPVWIKINYSDLKVPGLTGEECVWVCQELEKRGIDVIEVSSGISVDEASQAGRPVTGREDEGYLREGGLAVAGSVSVPVISVGGYRSLDIMEEVLNQGKLTAVSVCRPLMADPDWPKKLQPKNRGKGGRVAAVFFSPTHTTKKVVSALAVQIGKEFGWEAEEIDLTLPSGRDQELVFDSEDIVILGLPVYGGRIPELLEGPIKAMRGNGTLAAAVALYGNREYEDALVEMEDLLTEGGFCLIGAGAFLGEHSLTDLVAGGRPDAEDMKKVETFGNHLIQNLKEKRVPSLQIRGNRPYKARKAGAAYGPKTTDDCNGCMVCANHCPVGIISFEDPKEVSEGCLHCAACVKGCPVQAKYFDADGYYMIKNMLEEKCRARKEPELFF